MENENRQKAEGQELQARSQTPEARSQKLFLINRLQLFPRLKPHRPARRNGNFGSGARIAPDPGLARTHVEYAKSPQLNTIRARQRFLHALENRFHRQLGLGLGDAGSGDHFVDDVELNHWGLPNSRSRCASSY